MYKHNEIFTHTSLQVEAHSLWNATGHKLPNGRYTYPIIQKFHSKAYKKKYTDTKRYIQNVERRIMTDIQTWKQPKCPSRAD